MQQRLFTLNKYVLFVSITFFTLCLYIFFWQKEPAIFPSSQVTLQEFPVSRLFFSTPTNIKVVILPSVLVIFMGSLLRFIPCNNYSRLCLKSLVIMLGLRYIFWRGLSSLNFGHWISNLFTISVFLVETYNIIYVILLEVTSIFSTNIERKQEAHICQKLVKSGSYVPDVDIFIPTYNESEDIVQRTAVACQEISYPNKKIYILDDTRRENIKNLAKLLGCEYITRSNNLHRKAGNLNNALEKTSGELIACFDADFIPFSNFLERTVGFFQQKEISLVQTRQGFYNYDCHSKNLNLINLVPGDMDFFFEYVQPCRDFANSVICCGTSYIIRRSAITSIGGYYRRCCVEDFQTSSLLLTKNHKIIYLNEMLSRGEATRTYPDFVDQRLRWLQGILQLYYCTDEISIWRNYSLIQKIYALVQFIYCFQSFVLISFLVIPLVSLYTGLSIMSATLESIVFYYLPFFLMQIVIISWSTNYTMSFLGKYIQDLIIAFPAIVRVTQTVISPFRKTTGVTRKGIKTDCFHLNLYLTYPLLILLLLSVAIVIIHIFGYTHSLWDLPVTKLVTFIWIFFNCLMIIIALLSTIDRPERRNDDRFIAHYKCKFLLKGETKVGFVQNISLTGAEVDLECKDVIVGEIIKLIINELNLSIDAKIVWQNKESKFGIQFINVNLDLYRALLKHLYCKYQPWMELPKFSSFDSAIIILSSILRFKF